jgi:putative colanic acid biosynthesis UDP-glucose lipid carrier transferase
MAYKVPWDMTYALAAAFAVLLFYVLAERQDLRRSWRGVPFEEEAFQLWKVWSGVVLGLLVMVFVTNASGQYSRFVIVTWFSITPVVLCIWRLGARKFLRLIRVRDRNVRTVAIAGPGSLCARVAHTILEDPSMGLRLVGLYDDHESKNTRPINGLSVQVEGTLKDLITLARSGKVDLVYLALPMSAADQIRQIITELADTTVAAYVVPEPYVFDIGHSRWTTLGDIPLISIYESPFHGMDGWVKRLEDLVLASLLLIVVGPSMVLIAIGVKLTSPGPVIFKQRRYGLNGEVVKVWKFRTMTVCEDGDNFSQAKRHDPRVTRLGAFLRRNSLDELCQLFNVLQGSMSVVGPRPHPVALNEEYRRLIQGYMLRHAVKPGITGWAQVNGWRGETDQLEKMQKRVEYDLEYIRNWSFFLDLKILVRTFFVGITGKNAY